MNYHHEGYVMIQVFISKYQNFKVDLYVCVQCVGCLNCYMYMHVVSVHSLHEITTTMIHVCCECALSA